VGLRASRSASSSNVYLDILIQSRKCVSDIAGLKTMGERSVRGSVPHAAWLCPTAASWGRWGLTLLCAE